MIRKEVKIFDKVFSCPQLPTPATPQEITPIGENVKANTTVDAYWVRSWAQLNNEGKIVRIFCEWNAKDMDSVLKVMAQVPEMPLDGLYPMMVVDSEDFR